MKALITGITGFVGTHLAEHLLDRGDQVVGCSASGAWKPDAPPDLVQRVRLRQWDMSKPLPKALLADFRRAGFDCIYHLAAVTVPGQCGDAEPTPLAQAVNVQGTEMLLRMAAKLPSSPRVLFVSSCHVYEPVPMHAPPVSEEHPQQPLRAYGKTKLAAEQRMSHIVRQHGVDGIIVRAFQHAGPRQDRRLMLAEWCSQFAAPHSRPVKVRNMDSFLDFTDVRDVVRAYRLLIERGESGQVYNVGRGQAFRSGDLFLQLRAMADPACEFVETTPGPRQEPIADIRRLQQATGWRPEIPPETTLADALAYWRYRISEEAR